MGDVLTPRLVLHPMSPADAERLLARTPGAGDRWAAGYPAEVDLVGARNFLTTCTEQGDPGPFGSYEIRRRADGTAIGGLGFHGPVDEEGSVTIGYGLIPSERGRGYATEALRALVELARRLGARSVRGDTSHDNVASQHVMAAVGLRLVAEDDQLKYYELALTDPAPAEDGAVAEAR
ncbi:GNAT family N-acetyltransferase [Streptomyces sp. NRRL S-87]|uniref:GNAT family N-acetyltransferase n=1 Tax=Streptomyces sp. NRRL S-87 TaxID=1463920 RepID=UPI000569E989|nr:GNAT family N-acetyltransferase [Streptomyces sp. NRRL S-87]